VYVGQGRGSRCGVREAHRGLFPPFFRVSAAPPLAIGRRKVAGASLHWEHRPLLDPPHIRPLSSRSAGIRLAARWAKGDQSL